jgi:flagellar motor protein MotB
MRMEGPARIELVGHHDGREGDSPAARDAIARARAQAVHRYIVEVMHHPPAKYDVRLAGPDDADYNDGTATGRAHSRIVELRHDLRCSDVTCQPVLLADTPPP